MRVEKNGIPITSLREWEQLAPPKRDGQWVEGRSAFELANAWCLAGSPQVPSDLRALLDTCALTQQLVIEKVTPEHHIPFDSHGGEPRNADLALVGNTSRSRVAVTVEAKADEPFGATVLDSIGDALERRIESTASQGVQRAVDLVQSLFYPRTRGLSKVGALRYQLLTAVAGTLAYAADVGASVAVFVVHEFVTNKTKDDRHRRNAEDYWAFIQRLAGKAMSRDDSVLLGPFNLPGTPLFARGTDVFIGKVVTNRRPVVEDGGETSRLEHSLNR